MTRTESQSAPVTAPALTFPADFQWGTATASYQIEGSPTADGRGPSIWDTFSHTPGKVVDGDTGDVADDHYRRMPADVELMSTLGLGAYRFSIAWPRIVPTGSGPVNQAGLDFYSRLVDELLSHGIDPAVTLYHWDLPQPLQDAGGWVNRDTAQRFGDYAAIVGAALGDRVSSIFTLNEPWCSAFLGYASGVHAPGLTSNAAAITAAHHLNLAHGLGMAALRASVADEVNLSIALNLHNVRAASDSEADHDAARAVDAVGNRIFLGPIFDGAYPDDLIADTSHVVDWTFVRDGDLAAINVPIDRLGINYYMPTRIGYLDETARAALTKRWVNDPQGADEPSPWPGSDRAWSIPQPGPYTAMGWPIDADSLTELLVDVKRRCGGIDLVITENGAAFVDELVDGAVADRDRVAYLDGHLRAVHAAIEQGVNVRGYFLWSLMDNFEWAWGYSKRFGIVHVDYETQVRTPKASAYWYRDVIRAEGLS